jgi:hypothetical protein
VSLTVAETVRARINAYRLRANTKDVCAAWPFEWQRVVEVQLAFFSYRARASSSHCESVNAAVLVAEVRRLRQAFGRW